MISSLNVLHREQRVLEDFKDIMKELKVHGVTIKNYDKLSEKEQEIIKREFFEQIYPVIMPIAIDATHPFPHLNNLSFALALKFEDRKENIKYGLIRIPRILPSFLKVENCLSPWSRVGWTTSVRELFQGLRKFFSNPFSEVTSEIGPDYLEELRKGREGKGKNGL